MGLHEAIQNIWSSDYTQKNPNKAYKVSYANEYAAVAAYLNGGAEPAWSGFSKLGKGLCEAEKERRLATEPEPEPEPEPPPTGTPVTPGTGKLKAACDAAQSGQTLVLSAGTYIENTTCVLKPGVSIVGAGGRSGATVIKGTADPLIRYQSSTVAASIKGIKLDGQNRQVGTAGLTVSNVSNLTIDDVFATKFKGTDGVGAVNLNFITNCTMRNSEVRDSGHLWPAGATAYGSLLIGNATGCVFHDIVTHDFDAVGLKGIPGFLTNCEFYNLDCRSTWTGVFPDWDICFEFYMCTATNVKIHHSYFNSTMSLTPHGESGLPEGQYRYEIYNNFFEMAGPNNLAAATAIEPAVYNIHFHHNYFKGGAQALSSIGSTQKNPARFRVHHNVFDNQSPDYSGQIAYIQLGYFDWQVYKNTWVGRNGSLGGYMINAQTASSPSMSNNIFTATSAISDRFSPAHVGTSLVSANAFYNVPAKGASPLTLGAQPIPLTGGFPAAYVATGPAVGYGAMADGTFVIGPQ